MVADKDGGDDALQPADRSATFTLCAGAQPIEEKEDSMQLVS